VQQNLAGACPEDAKLVPSERWNGRGPFLNGRGLGKRNMPHKEVNSSKEEYDFKKGGGGNDNGDQKKASPVRAPGRKLCFHHETKAVRKGKPNKYSFGRRRFAHGCSSQRKARRRL